jgi:hypothetical protein
MNITIISLEFPPEPGGIGEYAFQSAKKLSEYGHNVLSIVHYSHITDLDFKNFQNNQNFDIIRIKGYNGRTRSLIKNSHFYLLFRQLQASLVIWPNGY